jgi:hypothetical protein
MTELKDALIRLQTGQDTSLMMVLASIIKEQTILCHQNPVPMLLINGGSNGQDRMVIMINDEFVKTMSCVTISYLNYENLSTTTVQ